MRSREKTQANLVGSKTLALYSNTMQNQKAFSSFSRALILPQTCFFLEEKETLLAICVREGLYESPPRLQRRDHELLFYTSSVLDEYIGSWMGP